MIGFYRRTLDIALRFQFITLLVFLATVGVTVFLYIVIPKGFFPEQDTGVLIGISEAGTGHLLRRDGAAAAGAARRAGARSRTSRPIRSTIGAGLGGQTENNGRVFIALKPFGERHATAQQIIAPAAAEARQGAGRAGSIMQAGAGHPRRRPPARRRNTSTRCRTPTRRSSTTGRRKCSTSCAPCRCCATSRTDQQMSGPTATLTIDRDAAARFGIQPAVIDATLYDAFGQRQVTQYFTQVNSYHLILEVPPDMQGDLATLKKLYVKSRERPGRAALHLRQDRHRAGRAARGEPPGPVPRRDALLQPRARRRARRGRHRDRQRHAADRRARRRCTAPSRAPPRPSSPRSPASPT